MGRPKIGHVQIPFLKPYELQK